MKTKSEAAESAKRNPAIKVIGVGGAGNNLAAHLVTRGLGELPCAVVNTDAPSAGGAPGREHFLLDAKRLRDLDVTDAERAQALFVEHEPKLKAWCEGADVIFIVTGLGGKTGSGISPVVARAAKAAGALVLGFATLPFECEGSRRQRQAQQGLERFKAAADGVICLPNQKILKLIDENTSLLDTFKISNDLLTDGVRGVWQLLSHQGLMEIQFDDLRDLIRDGRAESCFATAEAAGANRAREVVEKLLAHPLLSGGRALPEAASVLVSLVGGPGLTMREVNRVMEQINRHCEGAQVLMGAAIDAALEDRLAATVIIARREMAEGEMTAAAAEAGVSASAGELHGHLLHPQEVIRPRGRFVPPPPELSPQKMEELAGRRNADAGKSKRGAPKMKQEQLPLDIVSKGRFEKSEPTIHHGEDLDQPTYFRRGMVLN